MFDLSLLKAIGIMGGAALVSAALIWRLLHPKRDQDLGTVDMTDARRREIIDEEAKRWR